MEIEHSIDDKTQIRYGLIQWRGRDDEKYRQIFPDGKFTIDFLGEKLPNRKVDLERHRVSIPPRKMKAELDRKDILVISKSRDGTVVVRKKGVGFKRKTQGPDLPIVTKLRELQRNSKDPTLFEKALVEAFNTLEFSARHIGGRDEPDIFINEKFNIILDSKTTKEGVISERYINFDAMERYKEKYNAIHIGVIAPGFSEGYIRETAKRKDIVLIETETICKLLQNHAFYPYEPERIVDILFESDKPIITPRDVPTPTTGDQEKLIEIVAKVLSTLKNFEKSGITSFPSTTMQVALVGQGQIYKTDEIENALRFLSTAPFCVLQKQKEKYSLIGNIESILKKIGLLLQAFNQIGR